MGAVSDKGNTIDLVGVESVEVLLDALDSNLILVREDLNRYPGQLRAGDGGYADQTRGNGRVGLVVDYPWLSISGDIDGLESR